MESRLIKDYFTQNIITIDSSLNIKEAIDIMMLNKLHHLPVVNQERIVVGMISDRDILPIIRVLGEEAEKLKKTEVEVIMTKDVQVISADESLEAAAQMMLDGFVHALPVVDNQKLVGIISSTDILRVLVEGDSMAYNRLPDFTSPETSELES